MTTPTIPKIVNYYAVSTPTETESEELSEQRAGWVLSGRIPSLDGLRALSIFFVVAAHFSARGDLHFSKQVQFYVGSFAQLGVKIFFVLSGYLITQLLLHENQKTDKVDLGHFYIRRSFRILPACYFYLAVVFTLLLTHSRLVIPHSLSLKQVLLSIFFAGNYDMYGKSVELVHLWTLGVEEQFYLLWPAIFVFASKSRIKCLLWTVGLVPVINCVLIRYHWPFWGSAFYSMADVLACGCLMALLRHERIVSRILDNRWFPFVPFFLLIDTPACSSGGGGTFFGLAKTFVLRPLLGVAIAFCIEKAVRTAPVTLNLPWITIIGTMSYSIYLWQELFCLSPALISIHWLDIVFRFVCIGLCAAFSYYCIELPALQIRKRLFTK